MGAHGVYPFVLQARWNQPLENTTTLFIDTSVVFS